MAYRTTVNLSKLEGDTSYTSGSSGTHQCVALVQKITSAPNTAMWKAGEKVLGSKKPILQGTVIATFQKNKDGKYQYPAADRHAAIYVSHNELGITVYDQWAAQGMVKKRTIREKAGDNMDVNDASYYYVVD